MTGKLKTAILGATGYSGFELARILLRHPRLETPLLLQRSGETAAANLADTFPAISGNGGYPLRPFSWLELQRQEENSTALLAEVIPEGFQDNPFKEKDCV